ncbi:TSC22 domain family protein 2-like isoform X2 [Coregonus clupeaformis]|uniref:TSC22 domain family protein 2-like isoform X2 n=1 Tax=Coregonus clupeaformis TaxID=59861 RepID=UPI001BE092CA|nr:TSC22 domain family protein 2-like isoform X2 [Coregonus clupeaformis]
MSKMPAKKKSCFQITSVTQAQVAASSATDDTESLDDPDESRTEDVSSEIFDVSRADYEPEVCDRSSSEETLNHVGEQEAPGLMAPPHSNVIPQVGQLPSMSGPPNGGFAIRKVGVAGSPHASQQTLGTGSSSGLPSIAQSRLMQQPAPATSGGATNVSVSTSQPVVTSSTPTSTTTSTTSCSSRFRVIKLDHGTGEPFRRGRWTCTEFYEKDSEGNTVVNRTMDNIRHANALDPSADRDSGLGLTVTLSGQGLDSIADAAALNALHIPPGDTLQQQQQLHYQNYNMGQPGTATSNAFPTNKPIAVPVQQPALGTIQPAAPQNLLVGFNGLPQTGIHIQKSHSVPPAAQTKPLTYPLQQQQPMLQQLPLGHHLSNQPPGLPQNQAEYYQHQQHQPVMEAVASAGQTLSVASLSVGQPMGQGPSPVMTPAAGAPMLGQVGELAAAGGGVPLPLSQPAPGLMGAGMGGVGASMLLGRGSTLQQPVGQYALTGMPQPLGLHSMPASVQNVPTAVVAMTTSIAGMPTTVPSASNVGAAVPATMPNLTAFLLPGQQAPMAHNDGGAQGLLAAGFGQVEEGGRKVEGLAAAQPLAISEKNLMKTPEGLQLAVNPSVNSLFGIPIQMDWDEDSASGASVVAIDNKIEQAMDLVKSHLMYAVREEVEVLKEQIKELFERNSMLEQENAVLKSLANSDQLSQLSVRPADTISSCSTPPQQGVSQGQPQLQLQAPPQVQLQTQPPLQAQPQIQHLQPQSQQLQPQPQVLLQVPSQQLQPRPQQPQLHQPQLQLDASQPPPSQQPQPNVNSV